MLISRETVVSRLPKFMQTLDDMIYRELEKIAKRRGITIQELIRAVIVPEWINGHNGVEIKDSSIAGKLNNWR
jgi:Ribbon-helix-helix protein, copG family